MNDKERLLLTSVIGAQLGPLLDRLLVPQADQTALIGWMIAGIPLLYHTALEWAPRIMARFFPPIPKVNP
jgi:hypothetical protein